MITSAAAGAEHGDASRAPRPAGSAVPGMVSLSELRAVVGAELSDEDLVKLRGLLYLVAEEAVELAEELEREAA